MFVVMLLVSALAHGAEVNQEIVMKPVEPKAVHQTPARPKIVPQKELTVKELFEREQVRRQEKEMAAKIATGEQIIPAAGLTSTQSGTVPVVQAPTRVGSRSAHRYPNQRSFGGHRSFGGSRPFGGNQAPNGYITTAPAATVPANVQVYVGSPAVSQQPAPAKSGFWRKVGQATGFGPLFTEYRPQIAEYAATHGAVGASQFSGVPYQTTESVSASTWDNSYQPYGWGSRPNTSKGSYYGYSRVSQPTYGAYVPDGAAPTSYVRFESVSQRLGPQDYGVPGGSTKVFRLFGRD